jgi:hypothetical protein
MPADSASPKSARKQKLIASAAIIAILVSAFFIYRTQFAGHSQNAKLHQAVGQVMAEETSRLVGPAGKILLVTTDNRTAPDLKIQIEAFRKRLALLGSITIKDTLVLDPGDSPKYRPGAGLSAKHFLKIVRKNGDVNALVSFVGAPELTDQEMAQMKTVPKFIAETHSPERLTKLLEKKVLLSAIVPRFEFPAPGPHKPETSRQWFDRYFQVISPETGLVKGDDAP